MHGAVLEIVLDLGAIEALRLLDLTAESVRDILLRTPKLHLKPVNVVVVGRDKIIIKPPARRAASRIRADRQRLRDAAKERERIAMAEPSVRADPASSKGVASGVKGIAAAAAEAAAAAAAVAAGKGGKAGGGVGAVPADDVDDVDDDDDDEASASDDDGDAESEAEEKSSSESETDEDVVEAFETMLKKGGAGVPSAALHPAPPGALNYVAEVLAPGGGYGALSSTSSRDDTYFTLQALKATLPHVLVAGISDVTRAVIHKDVVKDGKAAVAGAKQGYKVVVEGYNLLEVMGVPGVRASATRSNHIMVRVPLLITPRFA